MLNPLNPFFHLRGFVLYVKYQDFRVKVKSSNFGHQVNSDIHLQTEENQPYEASHQDFH